MPRRPTTRGPQGRRSLPPRPTSDGGVSSLASEPRGRTQSTRPARLVEREAPYLLGELRRVGMVSGICVGLLVLLVVVDRLS